MKEACLFLWWYALSVLYGCEASGELPTSKMFLKAVAIWALLFPGGVRGWLFHGTRHRKITRGRAP